MKVLAVLLYLCGSFAGIVCGQEADAPMYATVHLNDCGTITDSPRAEVVERIKSKTQMLFQRRFKVPLEWNACDAPAAILKIRVQDQPLVPFTKKYKSVLFEGDHGHLVFSYHFFEGLAKKNGSSVEMLLAAAIERALVEDLVGKSNKQLVWNDDEMAYVAAGIPQFDNAVVAAVHRALRLFQPVGCQ